jgi:hypothetical protein
MIRTRNQAPNTTTPNITSQHVLRLQVLRLYVLRLYVLRLHVLRQYVLRLEVLGQVSFGTKLRRKGDSVTICPRTPRVLRQDISKWQLTRRRKYIYGNLHHGGKDAETGRIT